MKRPVPEKTGSTKRARADREALFPDVESDAADSDAADRDAADRDAEETARPAPAAPRSPAAAARRSSSSASSLAAPTAPTTAGPRSSRRFSTGVVSVALACVVLGSAALATLLRPESEPTPGAAKTSPVASSASERGSPVALGDGHAGGRPAAGEPRSTAPAVTARSLADPATEAAADPLGQTLAKLAAAQQSRDEDAVAALKDELRALLAQDPSAAVGKVFAALESTTDEQALAVLASLLSGEAALSGRPEVLQALTDMARRDDLPARRATAARTIGNLPGGDSARVDLLAGMGHGDADPAVREAAAVALGTLGDRAPALAASAARALVDGLSAEPDARVRSMLLYAVRDTRDVAVADALLQSLAQDPDMSARQAAADMLGEVAAAHRSRAVEALAARLGQETDPRFRSTILTSIVGAGRLSAIPVLEKLRDSSGDLQVAIDDYLAGLRSGEDSMDKLRAIKAERETARGGAPPAEDDDRD